MYQSTKTYEPGFSCAFRQWRADSHCNLIHGYALSFRFVFEAEVLDAKGWVVDFGGLDPLKVSLKASFDHRVIVADDDPLMVQFQRMAASSLIALKTMDAVGCEAFAKYAYELAEYHCARLFPHVRVVSAECREHGANSAIYMPTNTFGAR